jgi:hypothetical protein
MSEIKTVKQNSSENTSSSMCDIMKNSTSKVIKKMESQIPSYIQLYSDYYTEYLHSLDDLYGTCYIAEKEYFDKIGIDKNALGAFEKYANSFADTFSSQIEMSTNLLRAYLQMRISGVKSYDTYLHNLIEAYATAFSNFNKIFQKE